MLHWNLWGVQNYFLRKYLHNMDHNFAVVTMTSQSNYVNM